MSFVIRFKNIIGIIAVVFVFILTIAIIFSRGVFNCKYDAVIKKECENNGIDFSFVKAIICVESSFKEDSVSRVGAIGLMQVMPSTAQFVAEKNNLPINDLYNAEYNVKVGVLYLRYLFDKFEDERIVLCAYNAGEGNVVKWLKDKRYSTDGKILEVIPFGETEIYVNRVMKYKSMYSVFNGKK